MTQEELLRPRFKVIADYPDNEWKVGHILDRDWGSYPDGEDQMPVWRISQFPHLFKKLEWWEERSLYKKDVEAEVIAVIPYLKAKGRVHEGQVHKINKFTAHLFGYMSGVRDAFEPFDKDGYWNSTLELRFFEPATEEEYIAYRTTKP